MQVNCTLSSAAVANSFYDNICFLWGIISGNDDRRDFHFWKALCFIADFAMKVYVNVLRVIALTGIDTHGVFNGPRAIVYTVNDLVVLEGLKRAKKRYPVC